MIDPLGRVVRSLPLGTEGVLDSRLPEALPGTPYGSYGSWPTLFACIVSFFVCIVARYL